MIDFNRPSFEDTEFEYLRQALNNRHISGAGPFGARCEKILRDIHEGYNALLTTSCTHALELAAKVLRLEPGDEIIVPAYTFVSTASAFAQHSVRIVFADVDEATLSMGPVQVEHLITDRTRAVVVVHYAGIPNDIAGLEELCISRDVSLIEDNAHGFLGRAGGRPLGTFGRMSTLSFHETKNVTCGEGGALILRDERDHQVAEIFREKGTNRARFLRGQVEKYTWLEVGSSWVLSDALAALLLAQLERREAIQRRRSNLWLSYGAGLRQWSIGRGVQLPVIPADVSHPSHLFHVRLRSRRERDDFLDHLRGREINAVFHYQPLNTSTVGKSMGGFEGQCPVAERAAETLVRLPLFASMSDDELDQVIAAVTAF